MNTKYIRIISILAIIMIGLGCVDKQAEPVPPVKTPTPVPTNSKMVTNVSTPVNTPTTTPAKTPIMSTSTNTTLAATPKGTSVSNTIPTNTPTSTSVPNTTDTPRINDTNVSTTVQTDIPTNGTEDPQTENFKIGDSKNIFGINIKLKSIKIADVNDPNSDDMATIDVDGVEHDIVCYADQEISGHSIMVDNIDDSAESADITVSRL